MTHWMRGHKLATDGCRRELEIAGPIRAVSRSQHDHYALTLWADEADDVDPLPRSFLAVRGNDGVPGSWVWIGMALDAHFVAWHVFEILPT